MSVRDGLRRLRSETIELRAETTRQKAELEALHLSMDVSFQPKRGKRGGPSIASLQSQLSKTKAELERMEKVCLTRIKSDLRG
jgi:hypothetical protein